MSFIIWDSIRERDEMGVFLERTTGKFKMEQLWIQRYMYTLVELREIKTFLVSNFICK
jgi:hypothetical protein